MPLPLALVFVLASGLAASLAARQELRTSPRPVGLTRGFLAYLSYALLVVVPASAYFYVFHGDWFLLYWVDVQRVPSAVALIGFLLQGALGVLAFLLGAIFVRNSRDAWTGVLLGLVLVVGGGVLALYVDRLAQVGTYAQYHGQFGLEPFMKGPLLTGSIAIGAILLFGLVFLLARTWLASRRG